MPTKLYFNRWENNDLKREFIVGVGWRTLIVHLEVIKLTFQMKYYSVELGYIDYSVTTFHITKRSIIYTHTETTSS